jgi:hypothetical protein
MILYIIEGAGEANRKDILEQGAKCPINQQTPELPL